MRKSLIALLILAAVSVVFLVGATASVNGQEEAVEITEERFCGDPAAAEGLELTVKTTMDDYLHWTTAIFPGRDLTWDTEFRYTAFREGEVRESEPYFYLSTSGGVGTSTNYNSSLDLNDTWAGDPFGPIIADVASRAPAGVENYTEAVRLSDYMDYFPLSTDYYYDDGEHSWWPGEGDLWPGVTEFFRIPVGDLTANVDVSKNDQGGIYATGWEQMEMPGLNSTSVCVDGGVWLAVWGDYDENGVAQPMAEGAAEAGVYWIPIVGAGDEYGNQIVRVDEDNVRLAWQPENGYCVGLWSLDGGEKLLAQVSSETGEEMTVVDTASMEVEQTFPLDYDQANWMQLYVAEDHVVTLSCRSEEQSDGTYKAVRQWVEGWHRGADGVYEKVVSCDLMPAGIDWSSNLTTWCDGERLVLANLVDSYYNPSVYVAVCDGEGLQYAALLNHSQAWDPNRTRAVYTPTGVTVEAVE